MKRKISKNEASRLKQLFLRSALITLACVGVVFVGLLVAGKSLLDGVQIKSDYDEYKPKSIHGVKAENDTEEEVNIEPTEITDKTIMIFGVDKDETRTDTILIAHFNSATNSVGIASVPRDTKVTWTDEQISKANELGRSYQYSSKITDMSSLGGIDNLRYFTIRSVEEMLDIKVDNYVVVNTKVIREIVDKLGGIEVEVPRRMQYDDNYQDLHIDLQPGLQLLNGVQAEGMLRWRHDKDNIEQYARGDLGRIETQQIFIKAFANKVLNDMSLTKIVDVITSIYGNVKTDIGLGEALSYTNYLSYISMDKLKLKTLPGNDVREDRSYYIVDQDAMMPFINEVFYGIPNPDSEQEEGSETTN